MLREKDICAGSWCRLTKEIFEYVNRLGFKTEYNKFETYKLSPAYSNYNIFLIWKSSTYNEIRPYWTIDRGETGPKIVFL